MKITVYAKGTSVYQSTLSYPKKPFKVHLTLAGKIMTEDKNGLTQWPIKYDDGRIAYDNLDTVPKYGRQIVRKAFDFFKIMIK